ncbi:FkbM family methyltransferase [Leptolyngbya sp. FACHB-261]|uniref:FkbM family methyltransferase n=1 Tax=Leptolyngbya sp. FACHB-261 TaxID=2692806 RepID=UPI0016899DC5|nr:FkbM family methyltransferase [Leptolyngbya sp. FACHB-261]MBD2104543.1 FkbM family methyltransferase [Leptolyngbya sp. FACHB-261]
MGIAEARLPNGLKVAYLNQLELNFLYREIFEQQVYLRHGITVKPGDCVFDVGANIGLFSLLLSQASPELNLYCFEPIPAVFKALQRNSFLHFSNATLLNLGLSQSSGAASLTYYQKCSGWSTLYPDPEEVTESLRTYAGNSGSLLPWLRRLIATRLAKRLLSEQQTITCQLKTLSEVIQDQNISQINLLKIDAERSELDILLGIQPRDWPKIQQLVLEVQDLENRVVSIETMLKQQGFTVTAEQQPELKDTVYYNVYATRL